MTNLAPTFTADDGLTFQWLPATPALADAVGCDALTTANDECHAPAAFVLYLKNDLDPNGGSVVYGACTVDHALLAAEQAWGVGSNPA